MREDNFISEDFKSSLEERRDPYSAGDTRATQLSSGISKLEKIVNDRLGKRKTPDWFTYEPEFEQHFVRKFLKSKGFEDHSEKFNSMTNLAHSKRYEMKKMDMCAKHRKRIMRETNKWLEVQNIIKYGEYPYWQSDGTRLQCPSPGQVHAEIPYRKNPWPAGNAPGVNPGDAEWNDPVYPGMFFVPVTTYSEMLGFARHGYNPEKYQKRFFEKSKKKDEE